MSSEQDDLNRKVVIEDRDYFSYTRCLDTKIAKRVAVCNTGTPIEVDVVESGDFFNEYDELNSLSGLATSEIVNYTVPIGKKIELKVVECSGENKAVYTIEINSSVQSKKRSFYTQYNVTFNKLDLILLAGDNLKVIVENKRISTADFNANIIGVIKDA